MGVGVGVRVRVGIGADVGDALGWSVDGAGVAVAAVGDAVGVMAGPGLTETTGEAEAALIGAVGPSVHAVVAAAPRTLPAERRNDPEGGWGAGRKEGVRGVGGGREDRIAARATARTRGAH